MDEFVEMTSGLLRNVALAGIATIRNRAHRVLAKFDQSLDPAYLGHRLLLLHPPDAEDHLVAALGAELLSILQEGRPGDHADIHAIKRWLKQPEGPNILEPFPFPNPANAFNNVSDLLLRGVDVKDPQVPTGGKKNLKTRGTEMFTDGRTAAKHSDRHFAALLNLKTRYPGQPPRLTMGAILYKKKDERRQYLLCLQPKCDSIRLDDASGFPLIPLEPVQDGDRFRLVVETGKDEWERLDITPKPSALIVPSFRPGSNPPGEVLASREESGRFYFEDVNEDRYWWIAEMKDEHALRVAGEVASALARPGVDDAEWLRLASQRSRKSQACKVQPGTSDLKVSDDRVEQGFH